MNESQVTPPDAAHRRIWLITLLALVLLGGWMARYGPEPSADDYAQYLMHAQSLLDGDGYGDIDYLFSHYAWGTGPPIAAPGMSLSFVPVLATVGYGEWLHTGAMLLAILLLAVTTARYFGRWNAVHGAAAAYLIAVALIMVRGGSTLYPDIPFAVLCWIVVLLVDGKEEWGWGRTLAIAGFGILALLYRTAGIALVPSMLLYGALTWRSLRLKPLLVVAAWSATFWLVFGLFGAGQIPATPVDYVEVAGSDDITLVQRVVRNALRYRWPIFDLQLYPFPTRILNAAYHVGITALSAWALLRWMGGTWYRFAVVFLFGYVGMLLVAPVQSGRYFWPLLPFVAYGMVRALDDLLKVGPLRRTSTAVRVMGPLLLLTAMSWVMVLRTPPEPSLLQRESVQSLFQHFRELETDRPETRAVFIKPRTLAWHAGVPTMALLYPPTNDVALAELQDKRITHVVLGNVGLGGQAANERWRNLIDERDDLFRLEYRNDDFEVYAVGSD